VSTDHTTVELPVSAGAGTSTGPGRHRGERRAPRRELIGLAAVCAFLTAVAVLVVVVPDPGVGRPAARRSAVPAASHTPTPRPLGVPRPVAADAVVYGHADPADTTPDATATTREAHTRAARHSRRPRPASTPPSTRPWHDRSDSPPPDTTTPEPPASPTPTPSAKATPTPAVASTALHDRPLATRRPA
jgi:hypothetical protein